MPANEKIVFRGKIRWASVPPNAPRKPYEIDEKEPENCSYSVEVECPRSQFDELLSKGIPKLTSLKTGDDGTTYIKLRSTKIKGEYTFPDPVVVNSSGKSLGVKIGNGSTGIVMAELSPIKGRKGSVLRLKSVMITDLVPADEDTAVADLLALVNNEVELEMQQTAAHDADTGDW